MFGKVLKAKRDKKGMTQEDLSRETGVSVKSIGRYESGERVPSFSTAAIFSTFFGCPIDDFRETSNPPHPREKEEVSA